jgi:hypothetical protein
VGERPEQAYPDAQLDGNGRLKEAALLGALAAGAGAAAGAAVLLKSR